MEFQGEKNSCPCCSSLQCRLRICLNQDFKRKEIQQPMIWPTEYSHQIPSFDFECQKHQHQQAFSFQFQLQLPEGYDAEQMGPPENAAKQLTIHPLLPKTDEKYNSTLQLQFSRLPDSYRPLDCIQSILSGNFINIKLMQEEVGEDRLVGEECMEQSNPQNQKNANMPKFLIRLFFQHYRSFGEMKLKQMDESIKKFISDYERRYKAQPKLFYKLDQLIDLLRLQEWINEKNIVLRQIMNAIIRSKGRSQILKSSQLKRKASYLNAAKVYSLRCLHSSLSQRLQNK